MTLALATLWLAVAQPAGPLAPLPDDLAGRDRVAALAALPDAPGLRQGDREALDAALASLGPPPPPRADLSLASLAARLWDWFLDLLGTPEAERYASGGRLAFLGALGAAATAAWALRRRRAHREKAASAPPPAIAPTEASEGADRLAAGALARGSPAEAVRLAFLSALDALERQGRLPRRRDLTNRELARELSEGPDGVAATWSWLAAGFERVIYGRAPIDAAEASEFVARAGALRRTLAGSPR